MAGIDLNAQFELIPARAYDASKKLKAASQRSTDQLRSDAQGARDRATAAADRFQEKAPAAGDKASSRLHDIKAKCN